ncbi:MAG: hypothetical protein U0798_16505 [Gemmataceae bacterium]
MKAALLESIGRLFRGDLTLFVYLFCDRETGNLKTLDNIELPPETKLLYDFAVRAGRIVGLDNHDPACLSIDSRDCFKKIGMGDPAWEQVVPPAIVQIIKDRNLFGYRKKTDSAGVGKLPFPDLPTLNRRGLRSRWGMFCHHSPVRIC